MNAGDGLLHDVCENPDDDAPRLILADWLDENGDTERAELIRVQCELARSTNKRRAAALEKRSDELLKEHVYRWVEALPWPTGVVWCDAYKQWRYGFRRGFVIQATFSSARAYKAAADAVFAATPLEEVRFARLTDRTVKQVAASPYLARLSDLDVSVLTFGTIGELNRPSNELGESGGAVLLSSPHVGRLQTFNLNGNAVGDPGMAALAANPHFQSLRWLSAEGNGVGPVGARSLTAAHLPALEAFHLARNRLGDEGALALIDALGRFPRLTDLWLNHNGLTDAAPLALAASPHAGRLDTLNLEGNRLTAAGVRALVESPRLARLRSLYVAGAALTAEQGQELQGRFRGEYFFWRG
jgi:uncharacterized protein (TIGR02996 family)